MFAHLELETEVLSDLNGDSRELPVGSSRAQIQQSILTSLSHTAATATSTYEILKEAASRVAAALEMPHFVFADKQDDGSLAVDWWPSIDSEEQPDSIIDSNVDHSALSYALRCGHVIVVRDRTEEDRFLDPILELLESRSGIVCPLVHAGRDYGAIGVFTDALRSFEKDDVMLLHTVSLLLSPMLAYRRATRSLTQHSTFLSATIDSLDSMVLVLDASGKVLRFNRAGNELTGFSREEVESRHFWGESLLPKEELHVVRECFQRLGQGEATARCETFLVTKQGRRRRIEWSFTNLAESNKEGQPAIVASGIDITTQYQALAQLEQISHSRLENRLLDGNAAATPTQSAGPAEDDRRVHPRRPYPFVQIIGPIRNGKLPRHDEFREIQCHDISPQGFSFIVPEPPAFQELVVFFRVNNSRIFLTARVVHVSEFTKGGSPVVLVGCSYTGRLDLSEIDIGGACETVEHVLQTTPDS